MTRRSLMLAGMSMLVAALATFAIFAVRAQDKYVNPDAGLSDEERDAKYKTASAASVNSQAEIVARFLASGQALSDLRRLDSTAFYAGSKYDLAGASTAATEIVRGVVEAQRFVGVDGFPAATRVVSTVRVEAELKGGLRPSTIDVEQFGSPQILDDGTYGLLINANDPVLVAGTEVIVFAEARTSQGGFSLLPYKTLTISAGVVSPNPDDANGKVLDGRSADDVVATIVSALAAPAAGQP